MRPMGERERIIARRLWVMEKKEKGKSLDWITDEWNRTHNGQECSRSTIAHDIKESLKTSVEDTNLATLEWRMLHIARIEKVLSGDAFQKKLDEGDLFAMDRFDKLMDKLIKLTGAYAPTKVANTDLSGENESPLLTDEERSKLIRQIFDVARERKQMEDTERALMADPTIIDVEPG